MNGQKSRFEHLSSAGKVVRHDYKSKNIFYFHSDLFVNFYFAVAVSYTSLKQQACFVLQVYFYFRSLLLRNGHSELF